MKIRQVTVTGADDSIRPTELVQVQERFPAVEWGILVSNNARIAGGHPRFPSELWISELKDIPGLNLSCHICGKWVRILCMEGEIDTYLKTILPMFQRVQLNFHAIVHKINRGLFIEALKQYKDKKFIFQLDDVNNDLLEVAQDAGIDAMPLFGRSGGAGVLPEHWPDPKGYCGYAGGLSPDNLTRELDKIEQVAGDSEIWIDAESRLRSNNNLQFDLGEVIRYLTHAEAWMQQKGK